jgi:transposase
MVTKKVVRIDLDKNGCFDMPQGGRTIGIDKEIFNSSERGLVSVQYYVHVEVEAPTAEPEEPEPKPTKKK